MNVSIIGAEVRDVERQYSPYGVAIVDSNSFIADDISLINKYNTDVFCNISNVTIPVYSNLADIEAATLPNGLSVMVTDEAYPAKSRLRSTNFRLEYLGPFPESDVGVCHSCSVDDSIDIAPFLIPLLPLLIKVAVAIVAVVVVGAVIVTILNSVFAFTLPGGVSGHEREITENRKLITYPDGSWDVYNTDTGEIVTGGDKPGTWVTGIIVPIVLGVAGIAGIVLFVKYGAPALSKVLTKAEPTIKPG